MTNVELQGVMDRYGDKLVSIRTNTASTIPMNRNMCGWTKDMVITKDKIVFFTIGTEDFFEVPIWDPQTQRFQKIVFITSQIQHFVTTADAGDLGNPYLI